MQKLFFIGLLVGLSFGCFAQKKIKQYEYWFDNNHQAKKTTTISPSTSFTLNTSISTSGLPEGLHTLRIRFQDVSGTWSAVENQFFNKTRTIANNGIVKYEYWFDNSYELKKSGTITAKDSITLISPISTGNLLEGLHTLRMRFQDKTGDWSTVENQFFNKTRTIANNGIVKYEYWFDNDDKVKKGGTITAKDSISLTSSISTSHLLEGLHTLRMRFHDKTGAWSSVSNQFFIKQPNKLPIGENKITAYRFWLDKDFAKQRTVNVDPVNPLNLSSIIIPTPEKATPDNYEFFPDPIGGHKITYHSQFWLNIQFKDKINQWSVVTMDSVLQPYTVKVRCETLLSGVPKVKNYPARDTIHFFVDKAIAGDSLVFKSDKPLSIDLFNPEGKQIKTISKQESTTNQTFHTQLDGGYYALVHGFSDGAGDTYTLNYLHFPKYCFLSYNRKIVENNGTDTIVFKGNGFTKNTKLTLTSGGNLVAGETILCNDLTVLKASFIFKNTPVGKYDIHVNYGDTTIVIENGLEIVNSLTHTVLAGAVPMATKGNYPFAGVYEYNNLILDEGATLLSYGISQLVIKVKGTLKIGKDVSIRVRNGYYSSAPKNSTNIITKENIKNYASYSGDGYSLYANTYGKGGDGGSGATGGMGKDYLVYLGFNQYYTITATGGSGGGGGGGGFGGGEGGSRGILGVGTAGYGVYGGSGINNGGSGGFGGNNPTPSTAGGGAVGVGAKPDQHTTVFGAGGLGGGGNGGSGAIFGAASGGNGFGGPGGGGGGYGGGILVITANEIICDPISKPMFLTLGQNGGKGGIGILSVTNGGNGVKGEDGLVIVNTNKQVPEFIFSTDAFGSNYSPEIGGHGLVSGTAKVLINGNELKTAIGSVFSDENGEVRLTIYPNPTNGKITIETSRDELGTLVIRSMTGNIIYGPSPFNGSEQVDLSGISKGIYIATIKCSKKSYSGKIVVR